MKFLTAEPTVVINGLLVSTLPIELQNEIKTYDRMRQDAIDLAYQLETYELASRAKAAFIQQAIQQIKDGTQPPKSAEPSVG